MIIYIDNNNNTLIIIKKYYTADDDDDCCVFASFSCFISLHLAPATKGNLSANTSISRLRVFALLGREAIL